MQPAPPDFYTLSLHDALPISRPPSIGQEPRTVNRSLSTWRLTALLATLVLAGCSGDSSTGVLALAGDRKSTRLNSSHRCISYAVFCLKKKKFYLAYCYNHFPY